MEKLPYPVGCAYTVRYSSFILFFTVKAPLPQ